MTLAEREAQGAANRRPLRYRRRQLIVARATRLFCVAIYLAWFAWITLRLAS